MKANFAKFIRSAGLITGTVLALSGVRTLGAEKALPADAFPNFESYIKVTGQAAAITGSKSTFQNRMNQPANGGYGIEDFYYTKETGKDETVELKGHALRGSEDYLGSFKMTKNEVGTFEVGYKAFRTFYDGVGGFFPLNGAWLPLADAKLKLDRGKAWVDATVNLPNLPVFTLKYINETRTGQKDSTIWGDTDQTGLPNNNPPISQVRKIVPSFIDVGERHQLTQASVRHTIKDTEVSLTFFRDDTDNSNTRNLVRFPGESRLFPTPPSTQLVPALNMGNQVIIAETDGQKTGTNGFEGEAKTKLSDQFTLTVAGSYELVRTTVSGSRPLVTSTPTATGVVPIATNNYANLYGGVRAKDAVGKVELDYTGVKDLSIKGAVRYQEEYINGNSGYDVIAASGTPAITLATTSRFGWAKTDQKVTTPVLEIRYTGIKDLALYFTGSLRSLNGHERNTSSFNPATTAIGTTANMNVSEDHGNYTLGANWKQSSLLTLRGELYTKSHKDNSTGFGLNVGDYYLLDSQYSGGKLSAIVQPLPEVSLTTRYIYQKGKMQVTGFLPDYPAYDSLNSTNHMISQSVDWSPNKSCYVQVNATFVFNVISTIYPRAGITPATSTNIAFDSNGVVHDSKNDYVNGSIVSGWVFDKATDVQLTYTYYRANDGNAYLAPLTQPYGASTREQMFTVGLKHKLSETSVVNVKVGYVDSKNDLTGGYTNFKGPVAYVSFDHAL
jgi:hypothetical protein